MFGPDDVAIVGMRTGDLFTAASLEKIARITDALSKIRGVRQTLSITNAPDLAEDPFGNQPLLLILPPAAEEIDSLKKKLTTHPVLGTNLVAHDYKGSAIILF